MHLPSCLSSYVQTASGLSLCPFGATPSSCLPGCRSSLGCHLSLPSSVAICLSPGFVVAAPFPHPESAASLTVAHQASVMTERPKKGKRTSRMWCTQSFAKDDAIGRVGRLHGSVPNLSRYLESRDHSGPRGMPPPDYAHLQRSFWALAQKGERVLEGGEEQAGRGRGV